MSQIHNEHKIDVDALVRVAKLSPDAKELAALTDYLQAMLPFLALPDGEPEGEGDTRPAVLREDTVAESLPRRAILANANSTADGYITIPRAGREDA